MRKSISVLKVLFVGAVIPFCNANLAASVAAAVLAVAFNPAAIIAGLIVVFIMPPRPPSTRTARCNFDGEIVAMLRVYCGSNVLDALLRWR